MGDNPKKEKKISTRKSLRELSTEEALFLEEDNRASPLISNPTLQKKERKESENSLKKSRTSFDSGVPNCHERGGKTSHGEHNNGLKKRVSEPSRGPRPHKEIISRPGARGGEIFLLARKADKTVKGETDTCCSRGGGKGGGNNLPLDKSPLKTSGKRTESSPSKGGS